MSVELNDSISQSLLKSGISSGKLLLAVSGGSDSMALLAACHGLQEKSDYRFCVGHFDHGWRPESAQEAEFVRQTAKLLGLDFDSERVPDAISTNEESARQQRYDFLIRLAREQSCLAILTAHTADDQAETVLHHLLRGTGLAGLAGIPAVRPLDDGILLIRPLLSVSRAELRDYLSQRELTYRDDPTNETSEYTRGRIRNELFPALAGLGFLQVREHLCQLARQSDDVRESLSWMAEGILETATLEQTEFICRLDLKQLRTLPRHLLREVFVALWKRSNWPRQKMGFSEWDRLANLGDGPLSYQLPGGIAVSIRGDVLRMRS
ncbi:MAG TPA: tRNA lysidine(34) synthetase TilS [Planctomycetaceae bacterium]|nr:tRNA lysidine(34) synthetase TilS [Planctomycetaceae bacterium]